MNGRTTRPHNILNSGAASDSSIAPIDARPKPGHNPEGEAPVRPANNTRRAVLKTLAAAAAVPVAPAQEHQHESAPIQVSGPYKPTVLSPSEMKWLAVLVDVIIPRTETPGASDAGVPAYIDRSLRGNPAKAERLRNGIAALDAEARDKFDAEFPVLTTAQQIALLTPISNDRVSKLGEFFDMVKTLTVDGYYTSKEGLTQELGWHGNTYLTEFKGCTHPEHQS